MAEGRKIPRLGKAASEFNVAIGTITALLKKKNFDIVESPNTKLTPEMYDILLHEFLGEKLVKEEAQKIEIGTFKKEEDVDAPASVKETPEEETPAEDVIIQVPNVIKPEPIEIPVEPIKPKVLGKIDLEPKKKTSAKKGSTAGTKEEEPAVVETPAPKKEPKPAKEVEHIETEVENIASHIVTVGKIDLDSLNKKSKKSSKKEAKEAQNAPVEKVEEKAKAEEKAKDSVPEEIETKVEVAEPVSQPKEVQKPVTPEVRVPEHIETRVEKLQAPKIMGRIDLPVEKPKAEKPQVQNNKEQNEDSKKKKRKRIKQQAVKTHGKEENNKKPAAPKVEISEEDIQRQIKETMMRLEPLGKSKTSKRRREKRQHIHAEMLEHEQMELEQQKILKVTEFLTANELATLMNVNVNKIIATCMSVGLFVSINQRLDAETISLLADEYGFQVEFVGADVDEEQAIHEEDNPEDLQPRHPIITVMGHVDHGKTSLLDYIRKSNVIAGEAGGITQHIGAYEVTLPDERKITFLDTPGHEAFTAMRARGAKITDLCIIVIAADDNIMPQTVEAINHAQAAGVPMVFAITKIDKPQANPEKIKEGLAKMNILVEEWGGKYQCQEIDAKHGTNVQELLEKVLLEAELLDLKANPKRPGVGTVIESSLDKGKGYVAKVLVQNGTLKVGDPIIAGPCYGKVKALFNERNQQVQSAGPATPVLLLGLNGAPQAGDLFKVAASEHDARIAATKRAQLNREMGLRTQKHITLDEIGRRIAIGDFKELNIIVKGDVDGSVEALSDSLLKLSTEQVQVNVIHKSVGQVTESDVLLATASNAIIVAFQVRPSPGSRKLAEQEQIDIRTYSIIYTAINEIKDAIAGMHSPEIHEKILCNIEVKEVFRITKVGNVAGCMVLDGKLQRNSKIRLIRDGIVIYTGKLGSLRRFKDDVKEVSAGQDCGLNIENFNDINVGDIIEGYEEYEVKVTL
ncbi:MAG: translation initiation factor IF-2 [Bacteroidales bacterium]|nr:translation initiation factor IF-2 [Bacteroidales bacterium]